MEGYSKPRKGWEKDAKSLEGLYNCFHDLMVDIGLPTRHELNYKSIKDWRRRNIENYHSLCGRIHTIFDKILVKRVEEIEKDESTEESKEPDQN